MKDENNYFEQDENNNTQFDSTKEMATKEKDKLKKRGTLGLILIIIGAILLILDFFILVPFSENFSPIYVLLGFGGMIILSIGSILRLPSMSEKMLKLSKSIQYANKKDLEDSANLSAEISAKATRKLGKAFKEGVNEADAENENEGKKFCSKCGKKINKSARFCPNCGEKQN